MRVRSFSAPSVCVSKLEGPDSGLAPVVVAPAEGKLRRQVDNTGKVFSEEPRVYCWAVEDIRLSERVESTSPASPSSSPKRKLLDELGAQLNHLLVTLLFGRIINNQLKQFPTACQQVHHNHHNLQQQQQQQEAEHNPIMATVRPISPQYQHTLDSAISLAKELASKNMADSGDSSPKTPNSPDKKRFNFKLKHFSKSFSEASANIRDIESSISREAKQAYKSLVERGPYNSSSQHSHHTLGSHTHHHAAAAAHYANDDFSPSFSSSSKIKHMGASTFSVKKSFF